MFQNDCTLPLTADLFAQVVHPTEPLLTVGLSSGHVECFRLPSEAPSPNSDSSDGKGHISSAWRTRRHKGSCRALAYGPDGRHCYSAGTDALLKHFDAATGQVISKVRIHPSLSTRGQPDQPSLMNVLNDQTLLLACDSGAIHLYDLRDARPSAEPAQIHIAHDDFVSSITPLAPSDAGPSNVPRQFVSTGSTTLAVIDVRKGIMAKSDDQEDELLCSVFVPGLGPKKNRNNGILAVGSSSGVITVWDRGSWDDQQDRVYVNRLESVDALALVPDTKKVVAAVGNGHLAIMDMERREMETTLTHDDEGAIAINFDCTGRMISGGGRVVKVWEEITVATWENGGNEEDDDSEDEGSESDSDSDSDSEGERSGSKRKKPGRGRSQEDDGSSDDEDRPRRKKKWKKGRKGSIKAGAYGHHGVMGFPDL